MCWFVQPQEIYKIWNMFKIAQISYMVHMLYTFMLR